MPFTAAVIQLGPASPTIAETTARILTLMQRAASAGAKLAALPELALTPYFAAAVHDDVEPYASPEENDAAIARITGMADRLGLAITLPYAERTAAGLFNSMLFIDRGRRIGTFRKVHIPGHKEPAADGAFTILEKRYFTPGDLGFGVFETPLAKVGGLICYDRRFPESYRTLGLNGAEVIMVGYNTPVTPNANPPATLAKSRAASELAMRAGAYFTGSYVLGAGKAGKENGVRFIGGSVIIAPDGVIIAKARGEGDAVVTAEIDLSRVQAIRKRMRLEENRRPEVYAGAPA